MRNKAELAGTVTEVVKNCFAVILVWFLELAERERLPYRSKRSTRIKPRMQEAKDQQSMPSTNSTCQTHSQSTSAQDMLLPPNSSH
jgi:hypothetical protein